MRTGVTHDLAQGSSDAGLAELHLRGGHRTAAQFHAGGGHLPGHPGQRHYKYNNTGTIQNEADTPSGSPPQVQCFSYDYLGRLSQAWAQGSAGCVASMSQSAESGAAAPYWDQYS
jgi:hypothetical protein